MLWKNDTLIEDSDSDKFNETLVEFATLEIFKKQIARDAASFALQEYLGHTEEEAAIIVDDPIYTFADLKHIPTISSMLKTDLLLTVNSFYEEHDQLNNMPDPTCKEIAARMVNRFPNEPMIENASEDNSRVYERGPYISKGLVRRLLRSKAFKSMCEDERIAAYDYYRADANHVACLEGSIAPTQCADLYYDMGITPEYLGRSSFSSESPGYIGNVPHQDYAMLVMLSGLVGACVLFSYFRPASCIRKTISAGCGFFKSFAGSTSKAEKDSHSKLNFFQPPIARKKMGLVTSAHRTLSI